MLQWENHITSAKRLDLIRATFATMSKIDDVEYPYSVKVSSRTRSHTELSMTNTVWSHSTEQNHCHIRLNRCGFDPVADESVVVRFNPPISAGVSTGVPSHRHSLGHCDTAKRLLSKYRCQNENTEHQLASHEQIV